MELAPPSYEAATLTDVLTVIAPYIRTSDLCSATLVSRRFYRTIAPRLWGSPALHIGLEHDGIDDRLARFQKILLFARHEVRSLVHTLHIPSSEALYFDDRPADWLVKLLQRLPKLQSLLVHGLLYFDHAALQALSRSGDSLKASGLAGASSSNASKKTVLPMTMPISTPAASLKLLDASACVNITATSLAQALPYLSSLIYLNLSGCTAVREQSVLLAFQALWHLKILKLRGVGLNDRACLILAEAISRRVASLDLSNNELTDKSIYVLMQSCIGNTPNYDYVGEVSRLRYEDLQIYRSIKMESSVHASLTSAFVNRLAVEDLGDQGVTHLYLSGNQLSMAALHKLLDHHALNVLDFAIAPAPLITQPDIHSLAGRADTAITWLRVPSSALLKRETLQLQRYNRLQTLVVARFPATSSNDAHIASLVQFIELCAEIEAQAAQDYTLAPGSNRRADLHTIVLEVIKVEHADEQIGKHIAGAEHASAQDSDVQALWGAAEDDFTFFEGEKEKPRQGHQQQQLVNSRRRVDNIALLATFRQQRKEAWQRNLQRHCATHVTPGYWSGKIEIIRL